MRSSRTQVLCLLCLLQTELGFAAQPALIEFAGVPSKLGKVAALSSEDAARGLPVRFKGQVTYYDHDRGLLFLQEGDEGIAGRFASSNVNEELYLQAGQTVEIEGTTTPGRLKTGIRIRGCKIIDQGQLPSPLKIQPGNLLDPITQNRLVQVTGWIPTANTAASRLAFSLVVGPGASVDVTLNWSDSSKLTDLACSLAELTGVLSLKFDATGKVNGARLYVNGVDGVRKVRKLPVTLIADAGIAPGATNGEPFRVRGIVVNHSLGQFLIVRDSSGSMRIPYPALNYFNPGSIVEAFAYPVLQRPSLVLTNIVVKLVPPDTSNEEATTGIMTPTAPNTNLVTLTQVAQIRKLSPQEASRGYPVDITGVITFYDGPSYLHFVQDQTSGIYFDVSHMDNPPSLRSGQKVQITGFSGPGDFAPVIMSQTIRVTGEGSLPQAENVSFRNLMRGSFDSQWVTIKGVVRNQWLSTNTATLAVFASDGVIKVALPPAPPRLASTNLVDASVEINGVCRSLFDERRRLQGVEVQVPNWNQLSVRAAPTADPFTLPVKVINELFQFHAGAGETRRVRLMGIVTCRCADSSFFLQDGSGAIQIQPAQPIPSLRVGTLMDVVGFPVILDKLAMLQEATGHAEKEKATIEPTDLKPDAVLEDALQATLVRIEGQLLGRFSHGSEELLTVRFGQRIIDVTLDRESDQDQLAALQPGTVAQLTGVCLAQVDNAGNIQSFRLLLRSAQDIVVLSRPSWWTAERTLWALAGVATVLLLALGWVSALRRQVRQRTQELHAEIEHHKRTETKLEAEIGERKKMQSEVERTHQELLIASRQAGMAEVATSVLHNVGNVLNSVNVSAGLIGDKIRNSKLNNIARAAEMIKANAADLARFLQEDPKGRQLPDYLGRLADHLSAEQQTILTELDSLRKNVEHIKGIVVTQQNYAKVFGSSESVKPTELIEDALRMNSGALVRHDVRVVRDYAGDLPPITVDKHKMLQILVNLVCNAKKACDESIFPERLLTVRAHTEESQLKIEVIDNGVGIAKENLTRIFNHGFTTRKDGHGFGLHSGALAAKEMGGTLLAHSDGIGKGARFTLSLPLLSKS